MLAQLGYEFRIAGCETPTTKLSMRHNQAIEWIARPTDLDRLRKPVRRGWIIQKPTRIADELVDTVSGTQPQSTRLDEDLQFQETCR